MTMQSFMCACGETPTLSSCELSQRLFSPFVNLNKGCGVVSQKSQDLTLFWLYLAEDTSMLRKDFLDILNFSLIILWEFCYAKLNLTYRGMSIILGVKLDIFSSH